jgi:hypothetical protein
LLPARKLDLETLTRYAGEVPERWEVDHYVVLFRRAAHTRFFDPRNPRGKFGAPVSPDWLLTGDNAARVLEGRYDARERPKQASRPKGRPSPHDGALAARRAAEPPKLDRSKASPPPWRPGTALKELFARFA